MSNAQYNPNVPPQPNYQQTPYENYEVVARKSKIAAGLFGIFLGALGVHNFYLGHIGKGIAQLLITLLSLGMLSWVSAIWGLIEGVLILSSHAGESWHRDARNLELLD